MSRVEAFAKLARLVAGTVYTFEKLNSQSTEGIFSFHLEMKIFGISHFATALLLPIMSVCPCDLVSGLIDYHRIFTNTDAFQSSLPHSRRQTD